jgi:signal peptidase I
VIDWEPIAAVDREGLPPFAVPSQPPSALRTLAELPVMVLIAVVLAFVVKGVLAQAFFIPSASMYPQLTEGDRVLVSRVAYDLHYPRRGDIIVFDSPEPSAPKPARALPSRLLDETLKALALRAPDTTELIKRVVGLPGETVQASGGTVLVDGVALIEPYLADGVVTADFGPTKVPEGELFVLGDNRGNSRDSRFIGTIPMGNVVGRAIARVWPPTRVAFL